MYLLEAYNEAAMLEVGDDGEATPTQDLEVINGSKFCRVALTLLKRILDDSPRKVELLLND